MIVVTLIGVLSAIAVPMFIRYQLKSKSAECKTNLAAIRTLEEAYFSEYKGYVTAVPSRPSCRGSRSVFDSINSDFFDLGFAPEGPVFFSYGVAVSADGAGYTADAAADIDGDGIVQILGLREARPGRGPRRWPGRLQRRRTHSGAGRALRPARRQFGLLDRKPRSAAARPSEER